MPKFYKQISIGKVILHYLDKYTRDDYEVWMKRMNDLGFEGVFL